MASEGENKQLALARLRSWKDAGATLEFSFSGYSSARPFSVMVSLKDVDEVGSTLLLMWLLFAVEPGHPPFISSDGKFVVWFADATFSVSNDPVRSVLISRHPFSCVLREPGS